MADDDNWRFELSDLPPLEDEEPDGNDATVGNGDGDAVRDADAAAGADGAAAGNVAGEFKPARPVEPEQPSFENALFVLLGVVATLLFLVGPSSFDPATLDTTGQILLGGAGALVVIVFYRLFGP